jgi:hypothetical protein
MPARGAARGAAGLDIKKPDDPINLIRMIGLVGPISVQNGNIGFALRLFCETGHMTRLAVIDPSSNGLEQAPADAAQWIEIYFPSVEDLLRRLVSTQHEPQTATHSPRLRFWTIAVTFAASFICIPGGAAATMFWMRSNFEPPVRAEETLTKADRLPQAAPIVRAGYFGEEKSQITTQPLIDTDLLEPVALRGSIENAVFAAPEPLPPNKRKRTRNASPPAAPKLQAESPQPAPPPPSLIEKLSGMIHSIIQNSHQT